MMPLPGEINCAIPRHGFTFLCKPQGPPKIGPKWLIGGQDGLGEHQAQGQDKKDEYCRHVVIFKEIQWEIIGVAIGAPLLELKKYHECYMRLCGDLGHRSQKLVFVTSWPEENPPNVLAGGGGVGASVLFRRHVMLR
jgi:hypothetical protein